MSLIYVVEDDTDIREIEMIALNNSGYKTRGFEKGSDLFRALEKELPDLILLDIMLPDQDGYEILRKVRAQSMTSRIPIILVTAKTSEMDLVKGLYDGADDYIKKPFSILELIARVKALLRRSNEEPLPQESEITEQQEVLTTGPITLDTGKRLVTVDEQSVELTYKEFELLRYLMRNTGIVLSRDAIMKTVWDTDFAGETRTVDMHIKTLRQKLGLCGKMISTVRNVGYVISNEEKKA